MKNFPTLKLLNYFGKNWGEIDHDKDDDDDGKRKKNFLLHIFEQRKVVYVVSSWLTEN